MCAARSLLRWLAFEADLRATFFNWLLQDFLTSAFKMMYLFPVGCCHDEMKEVLIQVDYERTSVMIVPNSLIQFNSILLQSLNQI